jgi:hypothetical protein
MDGNEIASAAPRVLDAKLTGKRSAELSTLLRQPAPEDPFRRAQQVLSPLLPLGLTTPLAGTGSEAAREISNLVRQSRPIIPRCRAPDCPAFSLLHFCEQAQPGLCRAPGPARLKARF